MVEIATEIILIIFSKINIKMDIVTSMIFFFVKALRRNDFNGAAI